MKSNHIAIPVDSPNGVVRDGNVYNLSSAIKASKYPMAVDISKCTDEVKEITHKLAKSPRGSAHDNFLHGILVSFDLTLTNKAWTEWERYHHQDIVSSQSTMHRAVKIAESDAYNAFVTDNTKAEVERLIEEYNKATGAYKVGAYLKLLYNIPGGLKLTAHVVTNYGQLKTMLLQRHDHRLPEWREFCEWCKNLPYYNWISYRKE